MQSSVSEVVRRPGETNQRDGAEDVGRDGEKICLNRVVPEALDNLYQECADTEKRNTVGDSDHHVSKEELVFPDDLDCIPEIEFRVHHG